MGEMDCSTCGAKRELGRVICKYCNSPYGPDVLQAALPAQEAEEEDDGWERHWAYCANCQSLVYDSDPGGRCQAGGEHDTEESDEYALYTGDDMEGENGWTWCRACQCLYYGANEGGRCTATGGRHDPTDSGDYTLSKDEDADGEGWMWCGKCDVVFYASDDAGACAAGGEHEAGSDDYYAPAAADD